MKNTALPIIARLASEPSLAPLRDAVKQAFLRYERRGLETYNERFPNERIHFLQSKIATADAEELAAIRTEIETLNGASAIAIRDRFNGELINEYHASVVPALRDCLTEAIRLVGVYRLEAATAERALAADFGVGSFSTPAQSKFTTFAAQLETHLKGFTFATNHPLPPPATHPALALLSVDLESI